MAELNEMPSQYLQDIEVIADLTIWQREIALHFACRQSDGRMWAATNATMTEVKEGQMLPQPLFYLKMREAQSLMDQLWKCGLRPSEGAGSAGALAATQFHLEDMRRLVFETPKGGNNNV